MRKIFLAISCCLFALTSCEIDNYEGPDASIHGYILDEKTGDQVGTDIQNGSAIIVVEQGWTNPQDQTWSIMNTGEYRNNMIFAATYDVRFENCNFYPFSIDDFVVKEGNNEYNFEVTPYLRILNPSITKNGNTITATFSVEGGKGTEKLKEIQLFAFSDKWVGNNVKYTLEGTGHVQTFNPSIDINSSTVYTLTIDVAENAANNFKYAKNYYFRIGALADVSGVGTVRYNYAEPLTVIELNK